MTEYRCPDCGRVLFISDTPKGHVVTICQRCKQTRLTRLQPNKVLR